MLQGPADSKDEHLHDVLAFHIIPRLRLRDAWALSQACSSLWKLVQTGLPDATFGSLVRNSFPPGHPLLQVEDSLLESEIRKLASTHAAIRSGQVTSAATCCLYEAEQTPLDGPSQLNHRGDHALRQRGHQLELLNIDYGPEQPTCQVIWSQLAPDLSREAAGRCRIFWAPNDEWVAIWYYLDEGIDGINNFMYALQLDTKEIRRINLPAHHARMLDPRISPDSSLVISSWVVSELSRHISTIIGVYRHTERKLSMEPADPDIPHPIRRHMELEAPGELVSFSPDRQRFATAHAGHILMLTKDEEVEWVLGLVRSPTSQMREQAASSPDGALVALWQPTEPTTMSLGVAEYIFLEEATPIEMDPPEAPVGLLWGLYGIVPVFRPEMVRGGPCLHSRPPSSMLIGCMPTGTEEVFDQQGARQLIGQISVKIGYCMPALSPDGAFIAAIDPTGQSVRVYSTLSGACLSQQPVTLVVHEVPRGAPHAPTAVLSWAPSERSLHLLAHYPRNVELDASQPLAKELLTVFRF